MKSQKSKFKRVLLKLSGEALMGDRNFGIDQKVVQFIADELKKISRLKVEIALVIGGGNIFRGLEASAEGMERTSADYMGMLATVLNALAVQNALEQNGMPTRVQSAIEMQELAEPYIRRRAVRHLEKGRFVIFAAGTGNPYFTTDTASTLRAIEMEADVMLKGTRVDGVYTADPEKDPEATRYDEITFTEALQKELRILDLTAFTMCKENKMPIIVFDMNQKGNLRRLISGEKVGTLVKI